MRTNTHAAEPETARAWRGVERHEVQYGYVVLVGQLTCRKESTYGPRYATTADESTTSPTTLSYSALRSSTHCTAQPEQAQSTTVYCAVTSFIEYLRKTLNLHPLWLLVIKYDYSAVKPAGQAGQSTFLQRVFSPPRPAISCSARVIFTLQCSMLSSNRCAHRATAD